MGESLDPEQDLQEADVLTYNYVKKFENVSVPAKTKIVQMPMKFSTTCLKASVTLVSEHKIKTTIVIESLPSVSLEDQNIWRCGCFHAVP